MAGLGEVVHPKRSSPGVVARALDAASSTLSAPLFACTRRCHRAAPSREKYASPEEASSQRPTNGSDDGDADDDIRGHPGEEGEGEGVGGDERSDASFEESDGEGEGDVEERPGGCAAVTRRGCVRLNWPGAWRRGCVRWPGGAGRRGCRPSSPSTKPPQTTQTTQTTSPESSPASAPESRARVEPPTRPSPSTVGAAQTLSPPKTLAALSDDFSDDERAAVSALRRLRLRGGGDDDDGRERPQDARPTSPPPDHSRVPTEDAVVSEAEEDASARRSVERFTAADASRTVVPVALTPPPSDRTSRPPEDYADDATAERLGTLGVNEERKKLVVISRRGELPGVCLRAVSTPPRPTFAAADTPSRAPIPAGEETMTRGGETIVVRPAAPRGGSPEASASEAASARNGKRQPRASPSGFASSTAASGDALRQAFSTSGGTAMAMVSTAAGGGGVGRGRRAEIAFSSGDDGACAPSSPGAPSPSPPTTTERARWMTQLEMLSRRVEALGGPKHDELGHEACVMSTPLEASIPSGVYALDSDSDSDEAAGRAGGARGFDGGDPWGGLRDGRSDACVPRHAGAEGGIGVDRAAGPRTRAEGAAGAAVTTSDSVSVLDSFLSDAPPGFSVYEGLPATPRSARRSATHGRVFGDGLSGDTGAGSSGRLTLSPSPSPSTIASRGSRWGSQPGAPCPEAEVPSTSRQIPPPPPSLGVYPRASSSSFSPRASPETPPSETTTAQTPPSASSEVPHGPTRGRCSASRRLQSPTSSQTAAEGGRERVQPRRTPRRESPKAGDADADAEVDTDTARDDVSVRCRRPTASDGVRDSSSRFHVALSCGTPRGTLPRSPSSPRSPDPAEASSGRSPNDSPPSDAAARQATRSAPVLSQAERRRRPSVPRVLRVLDDEAANRPGGFSTGLGLPPTPPTPETSHDLPPQRFLQGAADAKGSEGEHRYATRERRHSEDGDAAVAAALRSLPSYPPRDASARTPLGEKRLLAETEAAMQRLRCLGVLPATPDSLGRRANDRGGSEGGCAFGDPFGGARYSAGGGETGRAALADEMEVFAAIEDLVSHTGAGSRLRSPTTRASEGAGAGRGRTGGGRLRLKSPEAEGDENENKNRGDRRGTAAELVTWQPIFG